MKVLLSLLFAAAMSFSANAHALAGEFVSSDIPANPTKMYFHFFNAAGVIDCKADLCFRLDIYLDGQQVARVAASSGTPKGWSDFAGTYTPAFNETKMNLGRIMGAGYTSHRGDAMPYAMFVSYGGGGFAVHGHSNVNGTRQSHGCIRIETPNAKVFNGWLRQVKANGGSAVITAEDTRP